MAATKRVGRQVRTCRLIAFIAAAGLCLLPVGSAPQAHAAPDVPDIDSLIDDSGPVPDDHNTWAPDLLFNTPSGLRCKKSLSKVVWDVACAGELPGAPDGTQVVTLSYAGGQSLGAAFRPTPPERFLGVVGAQGPILLAEGHKLRFFAYSGGQTLVCGVPASADLVCEVRVGQAVNGFVIASPQSRVF